MQLLVEEVECCDDMSEDDQENSPARAAYTAVHLRVRGVPAVRATVAVSCVKAEAMPRSTAVATVADQVKELKSKLWHVGREKGKIALACENTIRELKTVVKEKSRAALGALVRVTQDLEVAGKRVLRLERDNTWLRKRLYKQEKTLAELEDRVVHEAKRAKDAEGEARRLGKVAQKATTASEKHRAAYKARAGKNKELHKKVSMQNDEITALQCLAELSADRVDAGAEEAAELKQHLAQAEAQALFEKDRAMQAAAHLALAESSVPAPVAQALEEANDEIITCQLALEKATAQIHVLEDRLAQVQPPTFNMLDEAQSTRTQRRWVQKDVEYLSQLLKDRKWRVQDVSRALSSAGMLEDLFESKEFWYLRVRWVADEMKMLTEKQWSVDNTIGLMIDAVLSFGDLHRLRMAFSLCYSPENDRAMHKVWIACRHARTEDDEEPPSTFATSRLRKSRHPHVRLPEPIPPVEKVRLRFKEIEKDLKIEVSADGKVATHRFMDRLVEMHEEHRSLGLIHPACGTTSTRPHNVTYSLDAFPVEAVSVEHSGIFSSSLVVPSQSEEFFRIIAAGTIKENTCELNRMHAMRRVDKDFNLVTTRGYAKGSDGKPIHINLLVCCDKKAVEVLRGCSPGCAWCVCGREKRLSTAWDVRKEPATWKAAVAALSKVCSGAFPEVFDVYAWAHLAMPHEKLPRYCSVCKERPYKNEAEYEAALKQVAAMRSDTSKEGKAKFKAQRSAHAAAHYGQYLHEASNLMFNMLNVIPEVMHLDGLNVAKQAWTKGVLVLFNEHMREVATTFFKGMGVKLDVKTKPDGRAGSAWFKASVWAELVHGYDGIPGGLAGWFASLLFYIGQDFATKQTAFTSRGTGTADASSDEVLKRAYGIKGENLLEVARLFYAYKDWHDALHMETPDKEAREKVALRLAITANRLMIRFKAVAKETGKTWVYHIALFIVPRSVLK